jgi:hypothetical protein
MSKRTTATIIVHPVISWFLPCLLLLLLSGCAAQNGQMQPADPHLATWYVSPIAYGAYGEPDFTRNVLPNRPTRPNTQFTLVQHLDGRPLRSYDIVITDASQPDMQRPVRILFEWTGNGFLYGLRFSGLMIESLRGVNNLKESAVLVLIVAPPAIGFVGGFVIGLGSSAQALVEELYKIPLTTQETAVTFSEYHHDEEGRLHLVETFLYPKPHTLLIKSEYFYRNTERTPCRSRITSYPENITRELPALTSPNTSEK